MWINFLKLYIIFLVVTIVDSHRLVQNQNRTFDDGYDYETHEVFTSDGYILEMHRILPKDGTASRGSILMMHGLALTSIIFVMMGHGSLAYILADAGYDVWLGNSRGNSYSEKHSHLRTDSKEFWDFSFHDMGINDLPAKIDYILEKTNETSIYYLGYSQGGASSLVLLSMNSEYHKKIRQLHLIAPAVFMINAPSNMFYTSLKVLASAYTMGNRFRVDIKQMLIRFCRLEGKGCPHVLYSFVGQSKRNSKVNLKEILRNSTSSIPDTLHFMSKHSSTKQHTHFQQLKESTRFQMFDYKEKNYEIYKSYRPNEYNLNNVLVPTFVYQGTADTVVSSTGIQWLTKLLPNVKKVYYFEDWNHFDFFVDQDANSTVYQKILKHLN